MSNDDDLYGLTPMVIVRDNFLAATDRRICAASMLDWFNAKIATGLESAWMDDFCSPGTNAVKNFNYTIDTSIDDLFLQQCKIFPKEEIIDDLNHLIDKGYISIVETNEENDTYSFKVHLTQVHIAIGRSVAQSSQSDENEEEAPPPDPEEQVMPAVHEKPKSPRRSESRRVEYHNNRASRVGLPATLTVAQWTKTLEHFNWHCALCSEGAYEVLEHFIPIIHGGGTTEYNCIPTCAPCNRIKHDTHPSMLPASLGMAQSIQDVQNYLEARRVSGRGGESA